MRPRHTAGAGLRDAVLLGAVQACTAGLEPRHTAPSGGSEAHAVTSVGATSISLVVETEREILDFGPNQSLRGLQIIALGA